MRLQQLLNESPYAGYSYSYPHKTAYRRLDPPVPLETIWEQEKRDALFLYLHIPFCEMRCGFCNLFTTANPTHSLQAAYVPTLRRQAEQVRNAIANVKFSRMAVGGGTPTFLSITELEALFDVTADIFDIDSTVPASVETSPRTADRNKLQLLRDRGVSRISMGVQSFIDSEVAGAGRAQKLSWVEQAIAAIRQVGFSTLNLDLIYGLQGQSVKSWIESLEHALAFSPEELYLYPLYIRPLTGLDRWGNAWDDVRLECYRAGRDLLLTRGYKQLSMRMFRSDTTPDHDGPLYCCQDDGMLGIGCGARSYSSAIHYSSEFAVGAGGVREIIANYISKPSEQFLYADYGADLNREDQKRRWIIKTLLQVSGIRYSDYLDRFQSELLSDFPELSQLQALGLTSNSYDHLRLTRSGLERSDTIGPWLYSSATRDRMEAFALR